MKKSRTTTAARNSDAHGVACGGLVLPLPCPFCGCKPKIRKPDRCYIVGCESSRCQVNPRTYPCDLRRGDVLTKAHAVECWNRRQNEK